MGQSGSVQYPQGGNAARTYVQPGTMNTMGGTFGAGPYYVSGAPVSSPYYVQGGPVAGAARPAAPMNPGSGGAGEAADLACMSACFEPTGAVASEEWQYAGVNKGSYEKVDTYQYVGPGIGSVDKVQNLSYTGWKCRWVCIILISILALSIIGLLVWLLVRSQPAVASEEDVSGTGTVAFDCDAGFLNWQHGWSYAKKQYCCSTSGKACHTEHADPKECVLWGDPHIRTFDKSRLVFYSEGDFWLVKSSTISMQGRFQATDWTKKNDHTDYSSMTSIIIGGSFVDNHKIEVQSMLGKIYCDGQEILNQFGVSHCGSASIFYDDKGSLVDQAMAFLQHRVVHLHLPGHVTMQVNRWPNFINAKIFMTKRDGQDGICGNFNGVAADDMGKELHRRFGSGVTQGELLFAHSIPLVIPKALPSSRRCTEERRKRAEDICKKEETSGGWSLSECLGDVCDAHTAGEPSFQAEEMKRLAQHN